MDNTRGSGPDDDSQAEQVRSAERFWRQRARSVHALESRLEKLGWPEAAMRDLMRVGEDAQRS